MSSSPNAIDIIVPRPITPKTLPPFKEPDGGKLLTKKQRIFVENYMDGANCYQAAKKAGYSEAVALSASSNILTSPAVQAELRLRLDKAFAEKRIDTDWILQRSVELADSNILDYINIEEDGTFKLDMRKVNRAMGAAIQEISYDLQGRPRIRLADKKSAIELIAKLKKSLIDEDEEKGGDEGPITLQSLDKIVQNVTINNQQINIIQSKESRGLPSTVDAD